MKDLFKLNDAVSSLSKGGGVRALSVLGKKSALTDARKELPEKLLDRNRNFAWMEVDLSKIYTQAEIVSHLARSTLGGEDINPSNLGIFAREMGKKVSHFENRRIKPEAATHSIADLMVGAFQQYVFNVHQGFEKIIPVISFANLSKLNENLIDWLASDFNQALRKSKKFRSTRFIFWDTEETDRVNGFFDRFGFAYVKRCEIVRTNMGQKLGSVAIPQGVSIGETKELKTNEKSSIMNTSMLNTDEDSNGVPNPIWDKLSEKDKGYLLTACLPHKINRHTLEFFTDARTAAYCYNWLSRRPEYATRDILDYFILNEGIRSSARSALKDDNAESFDKNVTLASVLDAFIDRFPDPETHWIAFNLQVFDSFTLPLLDKFFNQDQFDQISMFIGSNKELLEESNGNLSFNEDTKMVTRRLMELAEIQETKGLRDRIVQQWELDQKDLAEKKSELSTESSSLKEEVEGIKQQILEFSEMRDKISEDFNNPSNYKPKRVYNFSASMPLIVLGLLSLALSLSSNLFGSFYGITGLVLTFFGFFWPTIQIQKPQFQAGKEKPKLAIETQQRSLNHRISGLVNRASSLKSTIINLDKQIGEMENSSTLPYSS